MSGVSPLSKSKRRRASGVHRRRLVGVAGNADVGHHALVAGAYGGLQRAAHAGDEVEVLQLADGVHLDQVQPVGLQAFEGLLRDGWLRGVRY